MHSSTSFSSQRGVALVISLLLLLIVTLIGVSGMQTTVLEEKMAGNFKDKHIAFQAAESALREAEAAADGLNGHTGMDSSCTSGMCYNGPNGTPLSTLENHISLGNAASATPTISGLPQPRYVIDGIKTRPAGSASWRYMYRIVVVSSGKIDSTRSELRSTYYPIN